MFYKNKTRELQYTQCAGSGSNSGVVVAGSASVHSLYKACTLREESMTATLIETKLSGG